MLGTTRSMKPNRVIIELTLRRQSQPARRKLCLYIQATCSKRLSAGHGKINDGESSKLLWDQRNGREYCLFAVNTYIFCNCSYPLLDRQKWLSLGVTIPTPHHLSSKDQNWRSYWSLTWPKSRCSRPNYSHFRENRKFPRQNLFFFSVPRGSFLLHFFQGPHW